MRRLVGPLIWLRLQVLVATVTDDRCNDRNYTAPSVIKVGLLQPLKGPLGFESTGAAATMAVRDARHRGYLNRTEFKYRLISLVLFRLVTCGRSL